MIESKQKPPVDITDVVTGKRINLLDWKAANIRLSWLLVFVLLVLLIGIAYLAARLFNPAATGYFITVAVVVALCQSALAYWHSDQIALRAAGARQATLEEHRYLVNITEAVAIGAGIPTPDIYVIDSEAPNAFATGRNPDDGAIAVTKGLIDMLDRQELEGVIAHEMAHIKNYDILFLSMIAATIGAIVLLRDLTMRYMHYGGHYGGRSSRRSGNDGGGGQAQAIMMILLVVLIVLAPVLATMLRFAISRRREYLADATGAYITRNPEGLARALAKLRDYKGEKLDVSEGVRHMFIVNPLKNLNAQTLLATHPPLESRIERLHRM